MVNTGHHAAQGTHLQRTPILLCAGVIHAALHPALVLALPHPNSRPWCGQKLEIDT